MYKQYRYICRNRIVWFKCTEAYSEYYIYDCIIVCGIDGNLYYSCEAPYGIDHSNEFHQ